MAPFLNPVPEPAWADSDAFERTFVMWQVSQHLGVLAIDEVPGEEPTVIFLPFIADAERAFWEGRDVREAGLTLSQLKEAVEKIERKLKEFSITGGSSTPRRADDS